MKRIAIAAAAAWLLWSNGAGSARAEAQALSTAEVDPQLYARPGQLLPVEGGRRLNLVCMGEGAPTVVLEAGARGNVMSWRKVQARIAQTTRVCAYDRAGYGFSDANDRPSTAENIADDLRTALQGARIGPQVVLVGHSAGGLYATYFADTHPGEVLGLVLVDPSTAGQTRQGYLDDAPAERPLAKAFLDTLFADMRLCAALAHAGRSDALAKRGCSTPAPAGATAELQTAWARDDADPKHYDAVLAEWLAFSPLAPDGLSEDDAAEERAARPFGDLPLVILQAGREADDPLLSAETNGRLRQSKAAALEQLRRRSSRGELRVVAGSGHFIQDDQPEAVVGAVEDVVAAARAAAGGRPGS